MHLEKAPEDAELFLHYMFQEFPEFADSFEDRILLNQYHLRENNQLIGSPVCTQLRLYKSSFSSDFWLKSGYFASLVVLSLLSKSARFEKLKLFSGTSTIAG